MLIILAIVASQAEEPRIIQTLEGSEFSSQGIAGELVERPAGVSDEEFARRLMEAEGLQPWDDQPLLTQPDADTMGTAAITSADGREINIKYVDGNIAESGLVCRLRFAPGVGAIPARWNAYRWCASAFGLTIPDSFAPHAVLPRRSPASSGGERGATHIRTPDVEE